MLRTACCCLLLLLFAGCVRHPVTLPPDGDGTDERDLGPGAEDESLGPKPTRAVDATPDGASDADDAATPEADPDADANLSP